MAIYQARFNRYLENRGLKPATDAKVWAFLGDGETDEPETLGAITLASRENLDNLIFVINCNLQRLDGPVRGNGKIVQELEAAFRGAGWNVIKVLWGSDWDPLFRTDADGLLAKRLGEMRGRRIAEAQSSSPAPTSASTYSARIRGCSKMVEDIPDEQIPHAAPGRPRSAQSLRRLQGAVDHKRLADGHSGAHDQGLRSGRKRRRQERHPPAEKARTKTNCASSARAFGFPSVTTRLPTRHSIARRRTARKFSTCRRAAKNWAAMCPKRSVRSKPLVADHEELFHEF